MKKMFLILIAMFILILNTSIIYASDVLVWQGQYYTGTTFNKGTYEFNFSVYDALTGGSICYSNATNLTTGDFGAWKIEQQGVSSSCNNISKEYYLNINIAGVDQTPRKRLVVWEFLRKNVDETTTGSITIGSNSTTILSPTAVESHYIKAKTGIKELNKDSWALKLLYSAELANTTLVAQEELALIQLAADKNISFAVVGESIELKKARLTNAAELAKGLVESNVKISKAKIREARELALLNGETEEDRDLIEEEARLKEAEWDIIATEKKAGIDLLLNSSLAEAEASDDGIRFCLSDGTNCAGSSGNSLTAGGGYLYNDSASIYLNETKLNGTIDARASAPDLTNYALKNQSETFSGNITATQTGFFGWLGSITSRITKLFVQDIDASGNIGTSQNVSAKYFIGNGSLLTNLPAAGNGLIPAYLGSDLNATTAAYATIFTIALTPGKMNIVQAYLAQSTSATGVAIRNRAIISESGPIGYCNFVTQTGGADAVDTIAVSANSADTGENTISLDADVPFINTITCTVIADASQRDLIIQFDSETVATVTTYAGSYYTNAVN